MIVLDTQSWFWWMTGSRRLSRAAGSAIDRSGRIVVPAICCWELTRLADEGRIKLGTDALSWIRSAFSREGVELGDLLPEIAVRAARLGPNFPGDPVDRMVVATAVHHGLPLVTADENIARSGGGAGGVVGEALAGLTQTGLKVRPAWERARRQQSHLGPSTHRRRNRAPR